MTMNIWTILTIIGLPSAVTTFTFAMLKSHIDKTEREREVRENLRDENMLLIINCVNVSMDFNEAVAVALKNNHYNGEVAFAQVEANKVRREYAAFITKQGVKNLR